MEISCARKWYQYTCNFKSRRILNFECMIPKAFWRNRQIQIFTHRKFRDGYEKVMVLNQTGIVPIMLVSIFSNFFFNLPSQSPKLKISALQRQNYKSSKYEVLQVSDGQENVVPAVPLPFASSAKSIPVLSIHAFCHNCLNYSFVLDGRRKSLD